MNDPAANFFSGGSCDRIIGGHQWRQQAVNRHYQPYVEREPSCSM